MGSCPPKKPTNCPVYPSPSFPQLTYSQLGYRSYSVFTIFSNPHSLVCVCMWCSSIRFHPDSCNHHQDTALLHHRRIPLSCLFVFAPPRHAPCPTSPATADLLPTSTTPLENVPQTEPQGRPLGGDVFRSA